MNELNGHHKTVFEAWKAGELEWCINQGIIKTGIITYCNIYDTFRRHREEQGMSYLQAVEYTANEMSTSTDTVKRAVAAVGT